MMNRRNDFWERERECERLFEATGPYWYVTTESLDWLLYKSRDEFIIGTNIIAISAAESGFSILSDIQMNNHHHVMGRGSLDQANSFRDQLRKKMRRFQQSIGGGSLSEWNIRVDHTEDLKQFRNRIAYTDRNAYVVRRDSTPTGYPWGSGHLMFNGTLWTMNPGTEWEKLTIDRRREICRSHNISLPETYRVLGGMILRSSFVDYKRTENLFNSANQYFTMLSRHAEADIEIANMLGESVQLPNEEVFQIVGKWFGGRSLRDMTVSEKLNAAKRMKTALASSNKQIVQVLQLPSEDVDRMFPRVL